MILAFSGTRNGMTDLQLVNVEKIILKKPWKFVLHGDCIGSDEQFHNLALDHKISVIIHPPRNDKFRAFCEGAFKIMEPDEYLVRDHVMVDTCDFLIATPKTSKEQLRSGTWATIRYARKIGRKHLVIEP